MEGLIHKNPENEESPRQIFELAEARARWAREELDGIKSREQFLQYLKGDEKALERAKLALRTLWGELNVIIQDWKKEKLINADHEEASKLSAQYDELSNKAETALQEFESFDEKSTNSIEEAYEKLSTLLKNVDSSLEEFNNFKKEVNS